MLIFGTQFINDTSLHTAFRDARALTCLPRSLDLPLPDFVLRRETAAARRDSLSTQSLSAPRDITIPASPSPSLPTSQSCIQLSPPVQHADSYTMEDQIQPERHGSRNVYEHSSTRASMPAIPSRLAVVTSYTRSDIFNRSRSSTLPSSVTLTQENSPIRLQSSFNSPPPMAPLPDVPDDPPDDYDPHIPRLHLPPPDPRHVSWGSQSSSSTSSRSTGSYPSPRTPGSGPPPYPGFFSKSAAIVRGNNYPPQREPKSTERPSVVVEDELLETVAPSMLYPNREAYIFKSGSSGSSSPVTYRDSPVQRERPVGQNFSFPLENALRMCGAAIVVRREVSKCIQRDRGYEQYAWLTVLQECGIAEEDIPFLLNEMAREAESISRE
jgi:hypothetical protein